MSRTRGRVSLKAARRNTGMTQTPALQMPNNASDPITSRQVQGKGQDSKIGAIHGIQREIRDCDVLDR